MTLERLGGFLSSDKADSSLRRTQQAFSLQAKIKQLLDMEPNVIIRDRMVVLEVASAAEATALRFQQQKLAELVGEVVGKRELKFRVKRRGRL